MVKFDDSKMKAVGKVISALPNTEFEICINHEKYKITARAGTSGKMKKCSIKILVGDDVTIVFNKSDMKKTGDKSFFVEGTIVLRERPQRNNPTTS